ncbi:YbaK/EbsC family protein [Patescibacteria group bacterium]|nr:YbaK/EbsC family protein [Patescibacteria group bacterium]
MLSKTIQKILETNKIKYEVLEHKTVYTAFDKAATLRARPSEVGKTVVVSLDNKDYALGLIPANKNLDKKKLLKIINNSPSSPSYNWQGGRRKNEVFSSTERTNYIGKYFKRGVGGVKNTRLRYSRIEFASEKWMKNNFKGINLGATPPFGTLYKLPFFIDNSLTKSAKIIVNGGAYETSIKLSPTSLMKLNSGSLIKGSFSMAKK